MIIRTAKSMVDTQGLLVATRFQGLIHLHYVAGRTIIIDDEAVIKALAQCPTASANETHTGNDATKAPEELSKCKSEESAENRNDAASIVKTPCDAVVTGNVISGANASHQAPAALES